MQECFGTWVQLLRSPLDSIPNPGLKLSSGSTRSTDSGTVTKPERVGNLLVRFGNCLKLQGSLYIRRWAFPKQKAAIQTPIYENLGIGTLNRALISEDPILREFVFSSCGSHSFQHGAPDFGRFQEKVCRVMEPPFYGKL